MDLKRNLVVAAVATAALFGATAPVGAAPTAVSPGINPGATYYYKNNGQQTDCVSGALCLSVWDYTVSKWKVFSLTTCRIYNVSNWEGDGYWENHQTKEAQGRFYTGANGTGSAWQTSRPWTNGPVAWTPINSVRPC